MRNANMDSSLFDKAAKFALDAHTNTSRKGQKIPYALHVMEVAAICASITDDQEILAAALLHDTIEDAGVTREEIEKEFSPRVAELVAAESEKTYDNRSPEDSWKDRKSEMINRMGVASRDAKIVALADKLSNMRSFAQGYARDGEAFWQKFHNPDPLMQEWVFSSYAAALYELRDTPAYQEFLEYIFSVFERYHEKVQHVDMNDWYKSGEGMTASSYFKNNDDSVMLKLYEPVFPRYLIEKELHVAKAVYDLGIPSPKPLAFVTANGRLGTSFERIVGKRSFARICADEPARVEEMGARFGCMSRDLHVHTAPDSSFPSAKEHYCVAILRDTALNEEEKGHLLRALDAIPDTKTCLHGDLHLGNAILTEDGRELFIDLSEFSYGPAELDLGSVAFSCLFVPEAYAMESFHCTPDVLKKFFHAFLYAYYDLKNEEEYQAALKRLMPAAALRMAVVCQALKLTNAYKRLFLSWVEEF